MKAMEKVTKEQKDTFDGRFEKFNSKYKKIGHLNQTFNFKELGSET
jgi:hypothetical protein